MPKSQNHYLIEIYLSSHRAMLSTLSLQYCTCYATISRCFSFFASFFFSSFHSACCASIPSLLLHNLSSKSAKCFPYFPLNSSPCSLPSCAAPSPPPTVFVLLQCLPFYSFILMKGVAAAGYFLMWSKSISTFLHSCDISSNFINFNFDWLDCELVLSENVGYFYNQFPVVKCQSEL